MTNLRPSPHLYQPQVFKPEPPLSRNDSLLLLLLMKEEKAPAGGKTQTVFIHKLYDMLEDRLLSHLIWWLPSNDSFCLYPGEEFLTVLAQYFKHTNIALFIRQLNMYGFHKVNDSFQQEDGKATPLATKWEFRHLASHFRKGDVELLKLIKRKASKVMSLHKEIVNLKPTLQPDDDDDVKAQQQQYHRQLYNQLWKQLEVLKPPLPTENPAPQHQATPTSNPAYAVPLRPQYPFPGYPPHQIHIPAPMSPSTPPFPHDGPQVPTPTSFVSQPNLRQPSSHQGLPPDQSINLKLIEMNNSIAALLSLCAALESRYADLADKFAASQSSLLAVVDILEHPDDSRDRLRDLRRKISPPRDILPGIADRLFKQYKISDRVPTDPPRHLSVLVDPLQPTAPRLTADAEPAPRDTSPRATPARDLPPAHNSSTATSREHNPDPPIQHYQPKVNHHAAQLYQPYIRSDLQQHRTASLPILERVLPLGFHLQGFPQRHSTTTIPVKTNDDEETPLVTLNPATATPPLRKLLPSVQELDILIRRSTSTRLQDLLLDDELAPKKPKLE